MTTRVTDIITRARDTLADPKKERWSDDRLLRLLDEAQKDFARQTSLLKGYANIPVIPYTSTYSLPEDCWLVTRAHYAERHLQLLSHEAMDERDENWYTRVGSTIEALVFDRRNDNVIRCYPIPDDSSVLYDYTFEQTDTPEYAGAGRFGVVTELGDYTMDGVYGVTTSLFDPEITTESFDSVYGVVTDVGESAGNIAIFYIRDPLRIQYLTDELEISARWDIAATSATLALGTAEGGAQIMAAADLKGTGKIGSLVGQILTTTGKPLYAALAITGAATAGKFYVVVEYLEPHKATGELTPV